jgi:hypothetical protein
MRVLFAAVALAALIPASAQAQETQTEERRVVVMGGPGGHMEIGEEGLTRDAFLARHTEMFARLDADGNGVVTRDEMHAMAEAHGDLPMRIRHPGGEGGPMVFHGEGGPGERDVVIIRRGPDGETINVEGAPGEWTSEDGQRRIIIGGPGHEGEGGERHVMVFRHGAEGGLDSDGDGRWSFEEMVAPMREHFNQLDANGDGFVDESERRH